MAEINQILYKVRVDTANGKVQIDGLTRGFVNAETAVKSLNKTITENNKTLRGNIDKTGLAGATLVEFSRTVSDFNYGFRAMANNISQLVTLFTTLIATTGSAKNAMTALKEAFKGPLGLIVVFQFVITALERVSMNMSKAQKEAKGLNDAIAKGQADFAKVKVLAEIMEDNTASIEDQRKALKQLKDEGYDPAKQSLDNFIESQEKLIILNATREAAEKALQDVKKQQLDITIQAKQVLTDYYEALRLAAEGTPTGTEGFLKAQLETLRDNQRELAEQEEVILKSIKEVVKKTLGLTKEEGDKMVKQYKLVFKQIGTTLEQEIEAENFRWSLIEKLVGKDAVKEARDSFGNMLKELEDEFDNWAKERKDKEDNTAKAISNLEERRLNDKKAVFEATRDIYNSVVDVASASLQRELTLEQNKTNAINNELKARLRNEKLSASERKSIQNQIAKNDEALRIKQEKIEEKRFNMQKAANIATATINTYLVATDVLAKEKLGAVGKIAAMVAVIGAGLAQVAVIAKQEFQSSSAAMTGGVVNVDTGFNQGGQAPDFNIVGQSAQSQLAQTIAGQLGKPTKAYIVSKDVTTAQELDRNRINGASLG